MCHYKCLKMNSVQELIDIHKHEMSTGLAKELLEACEKEARLKPRLYKITLVKVRSMGYIEQYGACHDDAPIASSKSFAEKQVVISECTEDRVSALISPTSFAKFPEYWLRSELPLIIERGDDDIVIIYSLVPFRC